MLLKRLCGLLPLLWLVACATTPRMEPAIKPEVARPAQAPPTTPFLRLETGGHTAQVNRIAVDAQERFLVSVSHDKTARVWDLASGKLLQTLRPPLGEGNEGKLYAVAIAPDGETVAVAGWTGWDWDVTADTIYLFDRASGELRRRLTGLPNAILHLAYSPDGRYLAAALFGGNGIHVFRTADGQELPFRGECGTDSYSAEFDRRGRLLTSCYDGRLRLYDADFKLIAEQAAPGGKQPFFARFSPDGTQIAVGFNDSTAVNLLSGADLHFLYAPNTKAADKGDVSTVAWSADGRQLYATGRYIVDSGWMPVLRWDQSDRGQPQTLRIPATDTVMDLRPLQDGRLAFGAQDPVVGLLQADGGKLWTQRGEMLDFRGDESRLRLSADGAVVEFGFDRLTDGAWQRGLARYDVANKTLSLDTPALPPLAAPRTAGEDRTHWMNTETPTIHGSRVELQTNEVSFSLALAAQGQGFLLGTHFWLRYYDNPQHQRWQAAIPGLAWAVNLSADGRYAVAAFGDGTIRWYPTQPDPKLPQGENREVLALYVHPDGKRWVAWTPEGFYDASPGAESLIGYHLNQGADQAGRFIANGQLQERFYRPDLIARRLSADGNRLIAEAVDTLGDVKKALADGLPPELELLSSRLDGFNLLLEYRVKPRDGGIGRIVYKVNGVEQEARAVGVAMPGITAPLKVSLPLAVGQVNKVELTVFNARNSVASQPLAVPPLTTPAADVKPTLYVLAVGIDRYKQPGLSLKYAGADAKDISAALAQPGHPLFALAPPKILLNEQATLEGITAAFKELAPKITKDDVFVLYLAGHGVVFDGVYHFIPQDALYRSEQAFRDASLNQPRLRELLKTILAEKSLILLDTCYAGGALKLAGLAPGLGARGDEALREMTAATKLKRATGRPVLMASSDKDMAFEGYKDHGFFSYALLQGLQGAADLNRDQAISTLELADFTYERVLEISQQRQITVYESNGNPFPIGYKR